VTLICLFCFLSLAPEAALQFLANGDGAVDEDVFKKECGVGQLFSQIFFKQNP
jgi:hypothetical protein